MGRHIHYEVAARVAMLIALVMISGLLTADLALGGAPPSGQGSPAQQPLDPIGTGGHELPGLPPYEPDELIVKVAGLDTSVVHEINTTYGTQTKRFLRRLGLFLLGTPPGTDPADIVDDIRRHPNVTYAQLNFITVPMQPVQGSLAFSDENQVGNYPQQQAAQVLNLAGAHGVATGAGVTVGVVDGGVDLYHPGLDGKAVSGFDYVDGDYLAFDEPGGDNSGHGTFVAGVVHLVAPDAVIRSYRVCDTDGSADGYLVAEAIIQAVVDGCSVVNLSLVMPDPHEAVADALAFAEANQALVVAAAGNQPPVPMPYPASAPTVLAVAAVDTLGGLADFSLSGGYVDVCAPGQWVYSTYRNDLFAWWSGTSFAAPFASGQAALLVERCGAAHSADWIRNAIITTADTLFAGEPAPAGTGAGVIRPDLSLQLEPPNFFWLYAMDSNSVTYGDPCPIDDSVTIFTNDDPASYTIEHVDAPEFIAFSHYAGSTFDVVMQSWDCEGLEPGVYQDTVRFSVDGCANSPWERVFTLYVVEPAQEAYAAVQFPNEGCPNCVNGAVVVDTGQVCCIDTFFVVLTSTNAPAAYRIRLDPDPEVDSMGSFIVLLSDTGVTDDTVRFLIDADRFNTDSSLSILQKMFFDVDGCVPTGPDSASAQLVLELTLYPGFSAVGYAWCEPAPVEVHTTVGSVGDTAWFKIHTLFSDTTYYVDSVAGWDGIYVDEYTYPSLHRTDDSVYLPIFGVLSEPGVHEAYVHFHVHGAVPWVDCSQAIIVYVSDTAGEGVSAGAPADVTQPTMCNYPNPFNPETEIHLTLPVDGEVALDVFNLLGQRVTSLYSGYLHAGEHTIAWNGRASTGNEVASGVYFYRLTVGDKTMTKKMLLLR